MKGTCLQMRSRDMKRTCSQIESRNNLATFYVKRLKLYVLHVFISIFHLQLSGSGHVHISAA